MIMFLNMEYKHQKQSCALLWYLLLHRPLTDNRFYLSEGIIDMLLWWMSLICCRVEQCELKHNSLPEGEWDHVTIKLKNIMEPSESNNVRVHLMVVCSKHPMVLQLQSGKRRDEPDGELCIFSLNVSATGVENTSTFLMAISLMFTHPFTLLITALKSKHFNKWVTFTDRIWFPVKKNV